MDLQILIETDAEAPAWAQVRDQLTAAIASGRLREGDRLESVRGLASALGVSPATIVRAYEALREDGLISTAATARAKVVVGRWPEPARRSWEAALERVLAGALAHGLDREQALALCAAGADRVLGARTAGSEA